MITFQIFLFWLVISYHRLWLFAGKISLVNKFARNFCKAVLCISSLQVQNCSRGRVHKRAVRGNGTVTNHNELNFILVKISQFSRFTILFTRSLNSSVCLKCIRKVSITSIKKAFFKQHRLPPKMYKWPGTNLLQVYQASDQTMKFSFYITFMFTVSNFNSPYYYYQIVKYEFKHLGSRSTS